MKKIFLIFTVLILGFFLLHTKGSNAQTNNSPQFLASWTTNVFTPNTYTGKTLPGLKSSVRVTFTLIQNGKEINISNQEVRWFVDSAPVLRGNGLTSMVYQTPPFPKEQTVRVELRKYPGGGLIKNVTVPAVSPEIVLVAPYNKDSVPPGIISMEAAPYFFNIKSITDILFSWKVNGIPPQGEVTTPHFLTITVPEELKGNTIEVQAQGKNTAIPTETTSKSLYFKIQ